LVNILILRLCNYDKSPDHVESAGKFTLSTSYIYNSVNKATGSHMISCCFCCCFNYILIPQTIRDNLRLFYAIPHSCWENELLFIYSKCKKKKNVNYYTTLHRGNCTVRIKKKCIDLDFSSAQLHVLTAAD
jgi:hypothetical protein